MYCDALGYTVEGLGAQVYGVEATQAGMRSVRCLSHVGPLRAKAGRAAYVVAAMSLLIAACGGAEAASPGTAPTLGSELAIPSETTVAVTSTSASEAPWAPVEGTMPPLEPLSSAQQIKAVVEETHGRTMDIADRMNRFVAFPDVPTPDRAELLEMRADARMTLDGQWMAVTSEVSFEADGTVEEIIEFYEGALGRRGWTSVRRTEVVTGGQLVHHLAYRIPETDYPFDDFGVEVRPEEGARSRIRLRYVTFEQADDVTVQERFTGWAADLPLPDGGRITGAGIQTSTVGRNSLHYSLALSYGGVAPATIAESLREALPAQGFSINPQPASGDLTDDWVYLTSEFFDESRVTTHETLEPSGMGTMVNVDARVEFTPSD